ncbi:MAG: DoxX family protein [Candidatus Rokubacteria bacterium]|nr:DoxX family protein [Candidatus Rokubacteria bacterium]
MGPWTLLVLRVIFGIIFAAHGGQKVWVFGLEGTIKLFTSLGIPAPALTATGVTAVELIGGLALVLGVLTRLAAGLLALDMLGAIVLVDLKGGFFAPHGVELPLALLAGLVALLGLDPGALSLDARRLSER